MDKPLILVMIAQAVLYNYSYYKLLSHYKYYILYINYNYSTTL